MQIRLVALVRHGETEWNALGRYQGRVDLDLNDAGERQARAAAEQLLATGRAWGAIVSSPLVRARHTAELIGEVVGLGAVSVDPGLIERSFGEAEGLPMLDASKRWPDGDFPGAESPGALIRRARDAWSRVSGSASDTIVICHVAVIRALVQDLCSLDPGHVPNGAVLLLEVGETIRLLPEGTPPAQALIGEDAERPAS